jgi:hypothetical protein
MKKHAPTLNSPISRAPEGRPIDVGDDTILHKLDWLSAGEWKRHSHAAIFTIETTTTGTPRLLAGFPDGKSSVLSRLVECLAPPFYILYVLHTPRGEGDPGRYQSPLLDLNDVQSFISRFSAFFTGDARFDLWVHSPASGGTIVWDRHNLIYGYGPTERYCDALESIGFAEGAPTVPVPHAHNYRPEFDDDAKALLSIFSWQFSELRPEDEQ